MWIYEPLELKTPDGGKSGRWRMTKTSDEGGGGPYGLCDCPEGHDSEETARECPMAKRELERAFPVVKESLTTKAVEQLQAEVERAKWYVAAHGRALDAVGKVFQDCSGKSEPILPDFLLPGEDKFQGVVKLAEAYVNLQAENATLLRLLKWCVYDCPENQRFDDPDFWTREIDRENACVLRRVLEAK